MKETRHRPIPKRYLILTLLIAAALPVALLFFTSRILFNEFARLEEREVLINVDRAKQAMNQEADALAKMVEDWAVWDDSYAFIQDRNEAFLQSNCTQQTFVNLHIDLIAFLDQDGKLVFGAAPDPAGRAPGDLRPGQEQALRKYAARFHFTSIDKKTVGLVGLQDITPGLFLADGTSRRSLDPASGPPRPVAAFLAAAPILTSNRQGPVRGTLVRVRYIDDEKVQNLSSTTRLALSLVPGQIFPAEAGENTLTDPADGKKVSIRALDDNFIQGRANLKDINGQDVLQLHIDLPRDISRKGRALVTNSVAWISVICAGFGTCLFFLVNRMNRHRARREQALQELAAIVESSNDAIIAKDSAGRIRSWNRGAEKLYGFSEEEALGKPVTLIIPEDLRAEVEPDLPEQRNLETKRRRRDGTLIDVSLTLSPLFDERGEMVGACGISRDITEKKRAAEELQRAHDQLETRVQERTAELAEINRRLQAEIEERRKTEEQLKQSSRAAEAANEAKSQFLANISHEIRTPLNAIVGFAEMIQSIKAPERQSAYGGMIVSESEMLLDLINELLDMSKVESGKIVLESLPFDLMALVNGVRSTMELRCRKKGIEFRVTVEKGVPYRLEGDPVRLRQILNNLAGNAVKFTEKGHISLKVSLAADRGHRIALRFDVEDTGIGIPSDKLGVIFEPFVQADSSTTRKFGGTGLGTSISKRLVEMMGGKIGVSSEPGRGSTFWFTVNLLRRDPGGDTLPFPFHLDPAEAIPFTPSPAENRANGPQVLLVEDYPPNREIALSHLDDAGCRAEFAVNGREAVAKADDGSFDIILMDVQMPEMDGKEATRRIRAGNGPNAGTPIIGMTASAFPRDIAECLDAGMSEVLTKPVRKALLIDIVNRWAGPARPPAEENGKPDAPAAATPLPPAAARAPEKETSPSAAGAPIDFPRVTEEFGGKKDVVTRVLKNFLASCEKLLPAMEGALNEGDLESVRKEAHKMKGGAANLTADRMAEQAGRTEKAAASGDAAEAARAMADLGVAFRELAHFVREGNA